MADHIHTFEPGASITCVAGTDLIGGRLVEISGPREVSTATALSVKVFGAAARDAKDGDDVLVLRGGVQKLVASGAIAAGARIKPAAGGKVQAVANGEAGNGLAITTTTAADQLVQVALD